MTRSEAILKTLLDDPKGREARAVYLTLKEWFEEEFGPAWLLKELAEAREHITDGRGSLRDSVAAFFMIEHRPAEHFIGTRKVSQQEFTLYCRGVFYMAGYQLLNS